MGENILNLCKLKGVDRVDDSKRLSQRTRKEFTIIS